MASTKNAPQARTKEPWRAYLRRNHLKTTQQREAIVEVMLATTGHVGLQALLETVRRQHPGVGLATVYRTVKLLEDAGLVESREFGPGERLYEVADAHGHHDHIICQKCQFIVEFESDEIEAIQDRVAKRAGFQLVNHRHELFGLCDKARGIPGGTCPAEKNRKS